MDGAEYKDEFDFLYVTVNRNKSHDLLYLYRTLGWENIEVKEHKFYYNLLDMTFRRPHKIENKDELQLLQVYLETALNTLGTHQRVPRLRALVFTSLFSCLIAALTATGLCLVFLSQLAAYSIWGWVCVGVAAAMIAPTVILGVKLYHLDGLTARARVLTAKAEIEVICAEASSLTQKEKEYE